MRFCCVRSQYLDFDEALLFHTGPPVQFRTFLLIFRFLFLATNTYLRFGIYFGTTIAKVLQATLSLHTMLFNYVNVAIRYLLKHRFFFLINTSGLSVGIVCNIKAYNKNHHTWSVISSNCEICFCVRSSLDLISL